MANLNRTQSRIVPQHKTEEQWKEWLALEENKDFCPKPGEIIIFDPDDNYNYSRFKIGRQKFTTDENGNIKEDGYYNLSELEFSSGAANGKGQNSLQVGEVGENATEALGDYSLAVGYSHTVTNSQHPTTTRGIGSVAIGKGNTTYGKQSAAFGCYSITGDKNGTAWNAEGEPFANTDTPGQDLGKNSLAAGYNNNAWGESTVALGTSNIVKGKASLAGGAKNETYSYSSVALGYKNKVGNSEEETFYGHLDGIEGASAGAIAIGSSNNVKHQKAIALGNNLISAQQNQILIGKYNKENQDAIMLVGTGTSDNKRHNTISIYDKNIEINGNLTVKNKNNDNDDILAIDAKANAISTTLNSSLNVTGTTTLNGNLNIKDQIGNEVLNINAITTTINNSLIVEDSTTLKGNLTVETDTTFDGNLTVKANGVDGVLSINDISTILNNSLILNSDLIISKGTSNIFLPSSEYFSFSLKDDFGDIINQNIITNGGDN